MKKVRFHTFGCKVNQYDTQMMRTLLEAGYQIAESGSADFFIINTCSVTAESERKARQLIRKTKRDNPDAKILVTGCYPQLNPEELNGIEEVSAVINNPGKKSIVQYLNEVEHSNKSILIYEEFPEEFWDVSIDRFSEHTRAFIKVEEWV